MGCGKMSAISKTLAIAIMLVFIDAFWLSNNIMAMIATIVIVVKCVEIIYMYLKILLTKTGKAITRQQLIKVGIYILAVISIVTINDTNNRIAKSRADMLITSCEKYINPANKYAKVVLIVV